MAANLQPLDEAAVEQLIAISGGKSREECEAALRAARGSADIAYEFLLTGIPEGLEPGAEGEDGEFDDGAEGEDGYGDEMGDDGDFDP